MGKVKQLTIGTKAPNFEVISVKGKAIKLSEYAQQYTLIAFLRYSGCPWCNMAVHRLAYETALLNKSQCKIIAFIPSSEENIIHNIYERHAKKPTFPIIADQKTIIYDIYGVVPSVTKTIAHIKHLPHWVKAVRKEGYKQGSIDGSLFLAPAMFLLDRETRIMRTDYNANLYDHDTFSSIYDAIAEYQLG